MGVPSEGVGVTEPGRGGLRLLHTSDWHIGRSFHGHSTLAALRDVLGALVELVRVHAVDVVLVSGDVFDSSTPSADAVELLDEVLLGLIQTGAKVVLTSGNHDSPARLGAKGSFAAAAGIHLITRPEQITEPIEFTDRFGRVQIFGIPFLEPARLRGRWPQPDPIRSQADALGQALNRIQAVRQRGGRAVVLAHTFVAGAEPASADSERDIVGGVDKVPVASFDGLDYVALGHIHSRCRLTETVRYCGAPLHYSFSESTKPRGCWLVELAGAGIAAAEWLPLPIPRELSVLTGNLEDLLADPGLAEAEQHWVSAILTDPTRPLEPMRRLQQRFHHCVHLEHRPPQDETSQPASYAALVRGRTDAELVAAFLAKVRANEPMSTAESELITEVISLTADRRAQR